VALPANVTGTTSYNADNEQNTFNGTGLSYDANGNLTGDGTNTYTWDAHNHLTQITQRRTTRRNLLATSSSRAVVRFYNKRGTAEQWIKESGNHAEQNRLKPCRGKPFRLWKELKFERQKGNSR